MTKRIAIGLLGALILFATACKKKEIKDSKIVTDFDGNEYGVVTIGTQEWISENLNVSHYNNGDAIPNIIYDSEWQSLSTGAYCENENSPANGSTYGKLYNYFAVVDSRKLCPDGWHVPDENEWQTLVDFLGGYGEAGGKMKTTGTTQWDDPNTGATNESGFSALPGGYRNYNGAFGIIGNSSYWASTTESLANNSYYHYMLIRYDSDNLNNNEYHKRCGYSVRCIKD